MAGSCECRLESAPLPPPEENKEEEECADDKDSEVADGWRVRKCHFRGLKHLRAVKIFPLTRLACGQPGEAHLDVGLIG